MPIFILTMPSLALSARYPIVQPCSLPPLNSSMTCNSSAPLEARLDDLIAHLGSKATKIERAGLLRNLAVSVEALHIPEYRWWNEALHGVAGDGAASAISLGTSCFEDPAPPGKQRCATSFPAAITTASSYNNSLTRAIGAAIGTEARVFSNLGYTGLTFWTPNVNIFRDPRWGRGQEHSIA